MVHFTTLSVTGVSEGLQKRNVSACVWFEDYVLLGCNVEWQGFWFLTVQNNRLPSNSRAPSSTPQPFKMKDVLEMTRINYHTTRRNKQEKWIPNINSSETSNPQFVPSWTHRPQCANSLQYRYSPTALYGAVAGFTTQQLLPQSNTVALTSRWFCLRS